MYKRTDKGSITQATGTGPEDFMLGKITDNGRQRRAVEHLIGPQSHASLIKKHD